MRRILVTVVGVACCWFGTALAEATAKHQTDPPVHQHIAHEAYEILGGATAAEFSTYVGAPQRYSGSDDDGQELCEGSQEEDQWGDSGTWVIDRPTAPAAEETTYFAHFWDPDSGYDAGLVYGADQYVSAAQKAQYYWTYKVLAYYRNGQRARSYYWLGHVAHLLADMSVPAHVLDDIHIEYDVFGLDYGDDNYEKYVGDHYLSYDSTGLQPVDADSLALSPGGYNYSSLPAAQGWDNHQTKLFKLFVNMAEEADEFDSDDRIGEGSLGTLNGNHNADDGGGDMIDANCGTVASTLMPGAMQYTAALYDLFWDALRPAPSGLSVASSADGQITLQWTAPTGDSGIYKVAQSYMIYMATFSGVLVEGGVPNTSYRKTWSIGTSKTITGLTNGQDYWFAVTAINSFGDESGYSNVVSTNPGATGGALSVTPTSSDLGTLGVGAIADAYYTISNSGGGTISWTATENPDNYWKSVYPTSGTTSTELDSLRIRVDTTGLLPSTSYSGTVTVDGGTAGSQNVTVSFITGSNSAPVLSWGGCDPGHGDTTTSFTFSVDYRDVDGDAPTVKDVVIDGTSYAMDGAGDYTAGVEFIYDKADFTQGTHTYYFYFVDQDGISDRYPASGTKSIDVDPAPTEVRIYEPDGVNDVVTPSNPDYTITWSGTAPSIELYYHTTRIGDPRESDMDPTHRIQGGLPSSGSFDWNVDTTYVGGTVTPPKDASYYIYAFNELNDADSDPSNGMVTILSADLQPPNREWVPATTIASGCQNSEIAVSPDGTLHVVYMATASDLEYIKSTDCGKTWSAPIWITDFSVGDGGLPKLAVDSSGNVHLAFLWHEVGVTKFDVYYEKLSPAGATLVDNLDVSNDSANYSIPCDIAVDPNGYVHVTWSNGGDPGGIYYARSTNGGSSFSAPMVVLDRTNGTPGTIDDWSVDEPKIAADASNVYIAFEAWGGPADFDGFSVCKGTSSGASWGGPVEVDAYGDVQEIAVGGGYIHVAYQGIGAKLFTARSTDGATWNMAQRSYNSLAATAPSVDVAGSEVCVVWEISGYATSFLESLDSGATWSSDMNLTGITSTAMGDTKVAIDPFGIVHVIAGGTVTYTHTVAIRVEQPDGMNDIGEGTFNITWTSPITGCPVDIYYDTDTDPAVKTLIASGETNDGSYVWDLTAVPLGDYYVYIELNDGSHLPVGDYSDGAVTVQNPNMPPTISPLPDVSTLEDTPAQDVLSLNDYIADQETADSALTLTITGNTNPDCGVSIDASHSLDLNPTANWNGTSTVTIQVSDGVKTAEGSLTVTVVNIIEPPMAGVSASTTTPAVGDTVSFTGIGSDVDGTIASWEWDFGDGGTSPLQNPTHIYSAVGGYYAVLTVTDDEGAKGSAGVSIAVSERPPTITGITPTSGPPSGGTNVTITGSDFQDGATVTIGSNPATSVAFVNSSTLTAVTPAGNAGAADVVVTNPDTQSYTLVGGFTYESPSDGNGGGCGSAGSAALVFLPFLIGLRKRRLYWSSGPTES